MTLHTPKPTPPPTQRHPAGHSGRREDVTPSNSLRTGVWHEGVGVTTLRSSSHQGELDTPDPELLGGGGGGGGGGGVFR